MKNLLIQYFSDITAGLKKNLGWKIFSLVIAICLWFVIINITSPVEVWTFSMKSTVTGADLLAESNDVVVRNKEALEGRIVTVKIRGDRLSLEALYKQRNELMASVNLGVIYDFSLEHNVLAPIDIIIPPLPDITSDKFDIVSKSPEYAEVTLEGIVTEERSVTILTAGETKEGYAVSAKNLSPQTVNLTGPKSKLNEIETVVVEASVSGLEHDLSEKIPPKLLDRDLNQVEGVSCDTDFIDVQVDIDKFKIVPVEASYVGEPATGYIVSSIEWAPKFMEIVAEEDKINEFNEFKEIKLAPVNVTGLIGTSTAGFDVPSIGVLPEGLNIRSDTHDNVAVTVKIEPITEREFTIPVSLISINNEEPDMSYTVYERMVKLTVGGAESKITVLNEDSLSLSLDLDGLKNGSHTLPVNVQTPENIILIEPQPVVTVTISGLPEENNVDE